MKNPMFIAETDENGAVSCVWVADDQTRGPRLFDPQLHSTKIQEGDCIGAPHYQIAAWLEEKSAHEQIGAMAL